MNEFVGKICPFCKTAFKEDDEIVVCSVCDMPHHKDCWVENKGCTTFGCLGTIKTPDGAPSTVTQRVLHYDDAEVRPENNTISYCGRCGSPIANDSMYCPKCGNPVNNSSYYQQPYSYAPNYSQQANIENEINSFVVTNIPYYSEQFAAIKTLDKKASWNWLAFLFAPYWLIYRKMYVYGASVLGAYFIFSFFGTAVLSVISIATSIVIGILGNYLYYQSINKHIQTANGLYATEKENYIAKQGGTNTTAVVISAIAYSLLVIIITAIKS